MTIPDKVRACHERCAPQLARLWILAAGEAAETLPGRAAQQAVKITGIVLAETEAAGQAIVTAAGSRHAVQAAPFLAPRLARMAAAARDAVAAAESGDAAQFRRQSRRFITFTSATWTVQDAMSPGHAA